MPNILIVDDDVAVRTSLEILLNRAEYTPVTAANPDEALNVLKGQQMDLVIMDMNYSLRTTGEEGLKLLNEIKSQYPDIPIVIITAWGSIPLAVEGMKAGAADFINKPWNNEHILQSIQTALSLTKTAGSADKDLTRQKLDEMYDFSGIVGETPQLLKLLSTIGRVANTNAPVLITGASGTGKELIAEAVHRNSKRRSKPFIKVNLGGIASSIFESEMFGHVRGAFTDAKQDRMGRFEMADTGTIFLDEIGDLDLSSQVKMLRVLQDRSFEILGSSKTKIIDVRIISATNRSLEEMVEAGTFREDLFYRINLITVKIPSLHERREDIPQLVKSILLRLREYTSDEKIEITDSTLKWLSELPWPGNIRELKNLVERTVLITGKNVLGEQDFLSQFQSSPQKSSDKSLPAVGAMTLEEVEVNMIKKAMEFHRHNVSQAAKSLGLSRAALYRRMEKYGISE